MDTLAGELAQEGHSVEFVVLSNENASDFVSRTQLRIFEDPDAGRPSWNEMEPNARKHDTFVYTSSGERALFWDASANNLGNWSADIRAAVEAQGQ